MKRVALVCLLASSIAGARELDGFFVGFEAGGGRSQMTASAYGISAKMQGNSTVFGGKVGYKYLFYDFLGIRGYANLAHNTAWSKDSVDGKSELQALVYSANVDILGNFFDSGSSIFGAFVGLGLGGQNWTYSEDNFNRDINGFYMDAKLGLRAVSNNHEMDFIVKIPFIEARKNITYEGLSMNSKLKNDYQILLGYNYSF